LKGTLAGRLADRTLMLAQGAMLDCNLDVAFSSAVPGMMKCTLTRNVYGDDGTVVVLERGTELTGQYQGTMTQGQPRLFVLWTRAKTPHGVIISLASPGTDALGRGGLDGYIDTHFWDRFGGALFLSVINDALAYAIASSQSTSSTGTTVVLPTNTIQAGKDAAAMAVENSIHIPPTLDKNQGEHVNVFVARDLDFRSVYALRAADPDGK
jgi:type IV secretion system protein VirB10